MSDSDTMANNAMSNNTVSNNAVSNNATVGDAMTSNSSGEGSSAVVSDLSDVTIDVVGVVVHVLDTPVGQVDGVVTLPGGGAVVGLLSVEPRSRVVVSNSVLVRVGGDLVRVDLSDGVGDRVSYGMSNWHSVSHSMTDSNSVADDAVSNANSSNKAVSNTDSVADSNSMTEASNNSVANESRGDNTDSPHPVGADTMGGAGVVSNSSDR